MEKKELFQRAYNLETEVLDAQEFLKELKGEYTYDEEYNPKGLPKDDVVNILRAAKAHAKQNNLKEKIEELQAIDTLIEEFS